mgnify:CR=1 FL=1
MTGLMAIQIHRKEKNNMVDKRNIEIMVKSENQNEATQIMFFLEELDSVEKKDLLMFMQGMKFAKSMDSFMTHKTA